MKDDGILLSEKHGLNPTIPLCFWCGKEKNEVALLGKLKDDKEAPKNCLLDYEPCNECKKQFDLGIAIIEVVDYTVVDNMPLITIQDGIKLYPTGRYIVVVTDAIDKLIADKALSEKVKKAGKLCLDTETFTKLTKIH